MYNLVFLLFCGWKKCSWKKAVKRILMRRILLWGSPSYFFNKHENSLKSRKLFPALIFLLLFCSSSKKQGKVFLHYKITVISKYFSMQPFSPTWVIHIINARSENDSLRYEEENFYINTANWIQLVDSSNDLREKNRRYHRVKITAELNDENFQCVSCAKGEKWKTFLMTQIFLLLN